MDAKKPYLAAILIQSIYACLYLLNKAAFNVGMNNFVFVCYRQALATVFLLPLALIFERQKAPPLSFSVFCKIFLLSLCGITYSLDMNGLALFYTSASLAAAASNTLPVITFFFAFLLRMETVKLRTLSGIAKVVGVILCLAGSATLAFYKGPHLKPLIHHNLFGHGNDQHSQALVNPSKNWVKGCFLMLSSNVSWGLWLVLQAQVMKGYPSKLLFTTLQCFLSAIQSFIVAIIFVRDHHQWKLHWDVGIVAVAYSGFVVTGVSFYLQTWVIEKKGPVFLAMFMPFSLVITIIFSSILLGEIISLGSVLGGILLVGCLYSVLWGKSKEEQKVDNDKLTSNEDGKEGAELKETAAPMSPAVLV